MIDHWLNDKGRRAVDKMGWPEWVGGQKAESQGMSTWSGGFCVISHRTTKVLRSLSETEALGHLQKHAREWLCERGSLEMMQDDSGAWSIVSWSNNSSEEHQFNVTGDTYDEALIAAVNATEVGT